MAKRQKIRQGFILVSFFLFPATFYYLSPVLIIQAANNGIINGSFILFGLLFLFALFLGRGWCGWLCPAAGCQEALFKARNKKVRKGDWFKWLIWFPWVGSIAVLATKAGGYSAIDLFYKTTYGFSVADFPSILVYFIVLFILIILPGFIFGRRAFCHHLCWMAPFMIIGRKIAITAKVISLRLEAESDNCIKCQRCTEHCPMSLPVKNMVESGTMEHTECILCGSCADICPEKTISLIFR